MLSSLGSRIGAGIAGAAILVAASVTGASAVTGDIYTVGYKNIFPITEASESSGDALVSYFSTDVVDLGGGMVRMLFKNSVPAPSTAYIGGVFVEDINSLLSGPVLNDGNVGAVDFKEASGGGGLPQGNKISFTTDGAYVKDGAASNGVQTGEVLGIKFTGVFGSIVSAIMSGDMRFGLHVQALTNGDSDSYVSGTSPVPIPAPVLLLLAGFGVAAFATRKRKEA